VDQALSVEIGAGVFFDALVGIVGRENAVRFARKFAPLEKVFANDVLGYEALAMFVYTTPMPWHEQINKALWQRLPNKGVLTFADALNSALTKIPPYGGVVYRGFTADNLDAFLKRYRRGRPIRMLGFTSASISPDKAFNGNNIHTRRKRGPTDDVRPIAIRVLGDLARKSLVKPTATAPSRQDRKAKQKE
jgi:hypothetical protein